MFQYDISLQARQNQDQDQAQVKKNFIMDFFYSSDRFFEPTK